MLSQPIQILQSRRRTHQREVAVDADEGRGEGLLGLGVGAREGGAGGRVRTALILQGWCGRLGCVVLDPRPGTVIKHHKWRVRYLFLDFVSA